MAELIRSDLEFILQQILIAEAHAAGADLSSLLPNVQVPFGLRTVDASFNHIVLGQSEFGAADTIFPRLTDPMFRPAEAGTSYTQTSGLVIDSQPRTISNLIVDQTDNNPAAVAAATPTRAPRSSLARAWTGCLAPRTIGLCSLFQTSRQMRACRRHSTPGSHSLASSSTTASIS